MSPSAPGPRREQMAPESADFSALAEHSSGTCLSPPSLRALPGTSLMCSSPPDPSPLLGKDGEHVGKPSSGVTGVGHQPHCAHKATSLKGQHHPFSQRTPSTPLTPDPPQAHGFHAQPYRSSLARVLHLQKPRSWLKGCAGSGSGAASPDVFPLLGMNDFGNWDCMSPFPKVKRGTEV